MERQTEDNTLLSSLSPIPGDQFWIHTCQHISWDLFFPKEGADVRKVSGPGQHFVATRAGSWLSLLCLWKNGGLSRMIVRDWGDASQVCLHIDAEALQSLAQSTRSWQHCSRLRWTRVSSGTFSSELDPLDPWELGPQKRLFWTTGCGLAGYASDYKVIGLRTRSRTPWLGWSWGEMVMQLARCFPPTLPVDVPVPNLVR